MAFHYSPKIVTDGLVLYLDAANYKSFQVGSTTWNDLSKNKLSGTLQSGATYSSLNGGCIVFDGIDDYMSVTSLSNTNFPQEQGTISIWYNIKSDNGVINNDSKGIFDNYDTLRNHFFIRNYSDVNFVIQISLQSTLLPSSYIYSTSQNISVDAWHNIVITYVCGSSSSAKVYIDGILVSSGVMSDSSWRPDGQLVGFGSSSVCMQGKGSIMKIYNKSLLTSEVLQNFNALKSRFGL